MPQLCLCTHLYMNTSSYSYTHTNTPSSRKNTKSLSKKILLLNRKLKMEMSFLVQVGVMQSVPPKWPVIYLYLPPLPLQLPEGII